MEPKRKMVRTHRLRCFLLAGEQEFGLRSEPRVGRTDGAVTQTSYGKPTFGYTNFLDTSSLPVTIPIGLTWGVNYDLPTTYSLTYLLNVQRTLGKSTTLEVGY